MAKHHHHGHRPEPSADAPARVPKKIYERELFRLQAELVTLQEWVRVEGKRLVIVFEGRDAAGKGSTIKRVTEYLNPRVARLAAMDLESITRWEGYSRAKDQMLVHTDIPEAPWWVVESDDKRRARLNMIQ